MHLVFLNQYYPPDAAPTGAMLEAVARRLVETGHEVTVLAARGGYAAAPAKRRIGALSRGGAQEDEDSATAAVGRSPRVVRVGATRFGRGALWSRLLDYGSYYLGVAWKLATLRPRPDRVVALTTPPYLSVLARAVSKLLRADHAHWVMDLYPDVMVAHGMLRDGGLAHRVLASVSRFGFGGNRSISRITLGPDMAERLGRHVAGARETVDWVPLWGQRIPNRAHPFGEGRENVVIVPDAEAAMERRRATDSVTALRLARGWSDNDMVVMYSGNMGLGHRFSEMLDAARWLAASRSSADRHGVDVGRSPSAQIPYACLRNIRFVFFGRGKRRGEIERFICDYPEIAVELHDYAPADELAVHLQTADVHLASLAPEWTGTMVPSKLQGIFAASRPVILIGSHESSIARWVRESGGGWALEAGDVCGLIAAIREAAVPAECIRRGTKAAAFARGHFDERRNAARIATLLARDAKHRQLVG
jgi:colanic acid biosynthesis glycosyl transferase WcaI